MKSHLLLLLFLFTPLLLVAQSKKIDSLLTVLNNQADDTIKAATYNALCENMSLYDLEKLTVYNNKLRKLSQKLGYQKGIGYYYSHYATACFYNYQIKEAIEAAKKAKQLLYIAHDWDKYYSCCADLGFFLMRNYKHSEAKQLLNHTIQLAKEKRYTNKNAELNNCLSEVYAVQSQYKMALIYVKKALSFDSNPIEKAIIYHNMSGIYAGLQNYELATFYNKQSMLLTDAPIIKNRFMLQQIFLLIEQNKTKQALALCLNQFQEIQSVKNYNAVQYNSKLLLIRCYASLKQYKECFAYLNQFLQDPNLQNPYKVLLYEIASTIHLELNHKKEALDFINKAISSLNTDDYFELKISLYTTKSKIEESLGHFQNALLYTKKQAAIKEAENIKNDSNKINELQISLNLADKDNRIRQLEISHLQNKIANKKQKEYFIYCLFAALLVMVLLFFIVKHNATIKSKRKILELLKKQLIDENTITKKSLQEKELLLKEIHHRVKNNMQLVMSLLNIQAQASNSISDFLSSSQSRILSVALIHQNLYESQNMSKVDFRTYVKNLTASITNNNNAINKNVSLQLSIAAVYLDIQKAIPLGLIINELVNNAFKHAFINKQKGKVTVKLSGGNNTYELLVSDNGVGMSHEANTKKTLGIQLIEDLVFQLGGILKIESVEGTQYSIQFEVL
jgi:two-component system, sensor histidine kinase PdtaS